MQAGTYATDYAPGDLIPIDNDGENRANFVQILGFNKDELADGSGNTAKIAAAYYYALPNSRRMNPARSANTEGTGTLGGWDKTEMKTYLTGTLWNNMDSTLKSMIVPVKKYTRIYQASNATAVNNVETTETVYLLSDREVFGSSGYETMGPIYSDVLTSNTTRKRRRRASASYDWWWLRSAYNASEFRMVGTTGYQNNDVAYASYAVVVGFDLDIQST